MDAGLDGLMTVDGGSGDELEFFCCLFVFVFWGGSFFLLLF